MQEKIDAIKKIFGKTYFNEADCHGGWYNTRKYTYSGLMIKTLTLEKLTAFIKQQINYEEVL